MDKVFHIRTFSSPNGACQEVELDLPATDYELLDAMEQLRLEDGKHPYLEFHAVEEYDYLNERIQETDIFPLNALPSGWQSWTREVWPSSRGWSAWIFRKAWKRSPLAA